MKKLVTTLLAIALILSMAACSSEEPVKETSNKSTEATAVQEESNQEETEELPEENPEESETKKEETKAEETKKEQADNQSTPESDTMELEGAPAQGSAVPFPLQAKISVKTSESNQWFSFTTENNTNYQVTLLPGDQYHHSIQLKFYNTSGEEVWSANTEGNGSATVKEVDLEKNTTYYATINQYNGGGTLAFQIDPLESKEASDNADAESTSESDNKLTNSALTVVTSDDKKEANPESGVIHGGTNQNDAVLLPMNTKLYGKTTNEGGLWYAFTTGDQENATYKITTINKTKGTGDLFLNVLDQYGQKQHSSSHSADQNGQASTMDLKLSPNTTYYINIWAEKGDTIDYALIIRDPDTQHTGYATSGTLSESVGNNNLQEIIPGSNQDDAGMIPINSKLSGKVSNGNGLWFAFTTNSVENAEYHFTTVNMTKGTGSLFLNVLDQYGQKQHSSSHSANQNGQASTMNLKLSPNTTYYINIWAEKGDTIDYTLNIQAPEEPKTQTATVENNLVFETPFELNSTQVMFVSNKAEFINEADAKAALKPVADVILAHPDHPILLAGTTATDSTQEECVALSNERAAAVKKLLVDSFGVQESQLQTVGLGFEADPFVRGKDRDANGNFVESEAAKNRRVIVMDANDPIAQEILNKK